MSAWNDDSWRDGYDAWKLRSPYEDEPYEDEPDEECHHDEYESDILTGRASCCHCPHSWWQTEVEIKSEIERIRAYDEWQREQNRRERWRRLTYPIRRPIFRLLERLWPRKACSVLYDEEIPF